MSNLLVRSSVAVLLLLGASSTSALAGTYAGGGGPLADSPATTTFDLVIGDTGTITDLDLTVDITHTFTGDLDLFLTHVNTGTQVHLFDTLGGSADDIRVTTFDDEAATAIGAGANPFNGSFRPFQALTAFDGEDINGTWRFSSTDNAGGDTGTLNAWSITASTLAVVPEPATYALFGLGLLGLAGAGARRRRTRPAAS